MNQSSIIIENPNQSLPEITLTLLAIPGVEKDFPTDKYGQFCVTFQSKKYKLPFHALRFCEYFTNFIDENPSNKELNLDLKYTKSEKAFDLAMKLLFGFKDVVIPKEEYIQFLIIIEELKISNGENFKQKVFDAVIMRTDETLLFEAYEMSFALNIPQIKDKCLQILISRGFKDAVYQQTEVNKLSESSLMCLLETHYELKKKAVETDQASNYLQSKEIASVIKQYYEANHQDETTRNDKISKCLQTYLIADVNEPIESLETFIIDEYYHNPQFLKAQLQLFQTRMLRLEKQNSILTDEIKELKTLIKDGVQEVPLEKASKVDKIIEQNEELKSKLATVVQDNEEMKLAMNKVINILIQQNNSPQNENKWLNSSGEVMDKKLGEIQEQIKNQEVVLKNTFETRISSLQDDLQNNLKEHVTMLQKGVGDSTRGSQLQLNEIKHSRIQFKENAQHRNISIIETKNEIPVSETLAPADLVQQQPSIKKSSNGFGIVKGSAQNLDFLSSKNKLATQISEKALAESTASLSADGVIVDGESNLITSSDLATIKGWIPEPDVNSFRKALICRLSLIYKGSRDGFSAKKFHSKCDNKRPTISFIKSQTYGKIFGGYTEQTWNHSEVSKNDWRAFIFSLTHKEKYPIINPQSAVYAKENNFMIFGDGYDICIADQCNSQEGSYSYFPDSFKSNKFSATTTESQEHLTGGEVFCVEEIEVYQVAWV